MSSETLNKLSNEKQQAKLEGLIQILKNLGFLNDERVEYAIRRCPRHEFVPKPFQEIAYENIPIPLEKDQTISQPAVVARMTEWLNVSEGQKILEVGSGSGWQSAILSFLVGSGRVFSIDRHLELVEFAKKNLNKLGITNVDVILGDGSLGLSKESPFNRIIITAACKKVPPPLFEQLSEEGLLIAPVGEYLQSMVVYKKTEGEIIEIKNQLGYAFVPLFGEHGIKEEEFDIKKNCKKSSS